jgi:hypothetical protein
MIHLYYYKITMGSCCSRDDSVFVRAIGDTDKNYITLNPYTESLIVEVDKESNKPKYVSSRTDGSVTIYRSL